MSDPVLSSKQNPGISDRTIPKFGALNAAVVQAEFNTEFLSLKSGYDTAKAMRDIYEKEYQFQPYQNEKQGQSAIVDSTIFDTIEWMLPTLIQPFMETNEFMEINPEGADPMDVIVAGVHRELLAYQMRKKNPWYQILHDLIKAALINGESYLRVRWQKKDLDKDEPVSRPVLTYINAAQIRYDWTVQNFIDSRVVTWEADRTRGDIIRDYAGLKNLMRDRFDLMLSPPGRNFKIGRLGNDAQQSKGWVGADMTRKNKADSLYTVREHWSDYDLKGDGKVESVLAIFIEDVLVYFAPNPLPTKRPPFFKMEAVRDVLGNPATGWAMNLSDIQKFKTALLRLMSDNMNAQQNGLYEVDVTNIDRVGMLLLQNAPVGTRTPIPVRKPGTINPLTPAPIAQHAFQIWELLEVAKENRSGSTRYSQGLDSKSLNQTATGIIAITQRSEMRMWEFATRAAEMVFKPLTNTLIAMNQVLLEDQDLQLQFGIPAFEVTRSDGAIVSIPGRPAKSWVKLGKKDLGGFFSVNIDVKVGSDKQQEIDNLLQWAQFFAPFVGQGVPKEAVSVIATEAARLMGIAKVELLMRKEAKDHVGARGVSVPIFPDGGGPTEGAAGDSGQGGQVTSVNGQGGVGNLNLEDILAGGGGSVAGEAPAPTGAV